MKSRNYYARKLITAAIDNARDFAVSHQSRQLRQGWSWLTVARSSKRLIAAMKNVSPNEMSFTA